ncbi:hypothetical protein CMV_023917 [Castanea mollissima]|uniref:Uncharacterized protein n=1 Tax=Castanea mollissima TaxID=60419 RepID=A0A8J4QBF7_9ROSI|nr:hypothetical protein CMV_023917 [Castanea mollissima]
MFSKLKTLQIIDLSHNPLLSFSNYSIVDYTLPNLWDLHLSSCNISDFPDFIKSMESLGELDLSNNHIKGNIPIWLLEVGMDSLYSLNLSNNSLTSIRHLPWKNLQVLDLSYNFLQGPLPIPPWSIEFFSVSRNNFSGNIPSLICNITFLIILNLSHNHFSNTVPLCLGNFPWKNLLVLNLSHNFLQGPLPIPPLLVSFFSVSRNNFFGKIPSLICNMTFLNVLDLSRNHLSNMNSLKTNLVDASSDLRAVMLRSSWMTATEELEKAYPRVVSCVDIVSIATKDGIMLG